MKTSRPYLIALIILVSSLLAGCAGGAGIATSWPGLTVSEDQNTAYVAYNQHVYAVNLADGTQRWRFPQEADAKLSFFAPPAIDGSTLLVGGFDHVLYRLDAATGQMVQQNNWPFREADNRYIASPLVENDRIYAPNSDKQLYTLDSSGNLVWKFTTGDPLWATPSSDGTRIYLPSMDHNLYALSASNGERLWHTGVEGALVGSPTVGEDGSLYAGTFNNELLAINSDDGSIRWRVPTGGWVWAGPAMQDNTLYFGDLTGAFYALDAGSGSVRWKKDAEPGASSPITDTPLVLDGTIYYTAENGRLYALDAQTGNQVWAPKELGGKLYTGPKAAGDSILVATTGQDALLVMLDRSGNIQRSFIPPK